MFGSVVKAYSRSRTKVRHVANTADCGLDYLLHSVSECHSLHKTALRCALVASSPRATAQTKAILLQRCKPKLDPLPHCLSANILEVVSEPASQSVEENALAAVPAQDIASAVRLETKWTGLCAALCTRLPPFDTSIGPCIKMKQSQCVGPGYIHC